jgi:hypothetical protein
MRQFVGGRIQRQGDPTAVHIGRALGHAGLDQQFGDLGPAGLDRDMRALGSDQRKDLAADLPAVMATAPGVGPFCPGLRGAHFIDKFAAHAVSFAASLGRGKTMR